jgi:AcrR family transcriptional regulator
MSSGKRAARKAVVERLDREQWLEAALSALAEGGVGEVRVEMLARRLRITKGSFYWHFKDRAALLEALSLRWQEGRVAAIAAQAAASGANGAAPALRLRRLLDLYLDHANPRGMAIELAMRDWARREPAAAAAVATVDKARLAAITPLYEALGHEPREATARALALYAYIFGQSLIIEGASAGKARELRDRCARLLIE